MPSWNQVSWKNPKNQNRAVSLFKQMRNTKRKIERPIPQLQYNQFTLNQIRKAKSQKTADRGTYSFQSKVHPKRVVIDESTPAGSIKAGNEFYSHNVALITQGDDINNRLRQEVYVKGVKVNFYVANQFKDRLLNVRWALVRVKGNNSLLVDLENDMFMGAQTSRMVSWADISNSMHKNMYALNREKFHVYAEGRKTLSSAVEAPASTPPAFSSGNHPSYLYMDEYIPVGSPIRFGGATNGSTTDPLVFIYWFCDPITNSALPVVGQAFTRISTITYFTDAN